MRRIFGTSEQVLAGTAAARGLLARVSLAEIAKTANKRGYFAADDFAGFVQLRRDIADCGQA